MKIVLDTDICKKNGENPSLILYLLSLFSSCKITKEAFEEARKKKYIKFDKIYDRNDPFPEYVSLTQTGEHIVEGILADSSASADSDERCTILADKLREIFPAGKKPGYAYLWRDSTSCIADRLKKFFLKYGNYPDEDIIRVTREYVNSFNGNYQYMQLLKYFIWKNKVTGEEVVRGRIVGEVERQSQLAAYLQDTPEKNKNADWDVSLR